MPLPSRAVPRSRPATVGGIMNRIIERVNSIMRRLRILEQDSGAAKTRIASFEQDTLNQRLQLQQDLSAVKERLDRQEGQLQQAENTLKEVIAQLKKAATVSDVKALEHTIDIYSPLKSAFVTREEVERMLAEREGRTEEGQ